MSGRYDDIINIPYRGSKRADKMPMEDRAAQLAPFAALTGLEEAIRDADREHEKMEESRVTGDGKKSEIGYHPDRHKKQERQE